MTLSPDLPRISRSRHTVLTDDGVELGAESVGEGPAVLLVNGIGVVAPGLDHLAEHLSSRHRVITWDYRGLGRSVIRRWPVAVDMPRQARDALQILDALGEDRAAVLGWSLGVPIGLEMIRLAPERVIAYGALFGAPGQPFRTAFRFPADAIVHGLVRFACRAPQLSQAVLRLGIALPRLTWAVCSGINFVGPLAHRAVFHADVQSTYDAEKRAYFRTMAEMMEHDASDLLEAVRCPALVVCGELDWVTPPAAAAEMARRIPSARLVQLAGTSHFGVIEHGPALWEPVDELLARAGWIAAPPSATPGRRPRRRR